MSARPRGPKNVNAARRSDPIPPPPPSAPVERDRAAEKARRGLVAVAIGVAVVVLAGVAVFALTRAAPPRRSHSRSRSSEGQSQTYEIDQTIDAEVASDVFGSESVLDGHVAGRELEMPSVDEEGNATIEVTVSETSGTVNGQEIPQAELGSVPPVEIETAPDGRVISAGGLALGGAGELRASGSRGWGSSRRSCRTRARRSRSATRGRRSSRRTFGEARPLLGREHLEL